MPPSDVKKVCQSESTLLWPRLSFQVASTVAAAAAIPASQTVNPRLRTIICTSPTSAGVGSSGSRRVATRLAAMSASGQRLRQTVKMASPTPTNQTSNDRPDISPV